MMIASQTSITRALQKNTCLAQEPVITQNTTKRVIEILYAKYDKAKKTSHSKEQLSSSRSVTKREAALIPTCLFDGTLGDWNRPPVFIEVNEGARPYHCRPYPIPQMQKSCSIEKAQQTSIYRGLEEAIIIAMGLPNIHNPKDGCDCADNCRF
jgi:hypothetical protein